jgi:drug/metabolite transporter (DMT)-like permease
MIETWVVATIIAAVAQTFRSATQKKMIPVLGDGGASYIRFSYAIPFAWFWVFGYQIYSGISLPAINPGFWVWVSLASLMQVLFTAFLIAMFSHRSFAAGTAFSKTEVLQAAIYEAFLLGIVVSVLTGTAILLGAIAVVMLSLAKADFKEKGFMATLFSRQTAIGLASGSCLGLATVFFKAAILELNGGDLLLNASYAGGIAVLIQTIAMGVWLRVTKPEELKLCLIHWRDSLAAGFWGALATIGWFTAFTLYAVAPVRAVGQVELLITMGVSVFYFKEKMSWFEAFSILLLTISIVMVLLG